MKRAIKKVTKKVMPAHTRRGKALHNAAAKAGLVNPLYVNAEYKKWIKFVEPDTFLPIVKQQQTTEVLFSIVIPFFNTPDKYLAPLLESICGQSFGNWELIAGDASTDPERQKVIEKAAKQDKRIKYVRIQNNMGISGNTNQALEHATGKYIVFSDHDDTLNHHALNEVARHVLTDPSIDILYSDEDKLSDNGKWRHSPYFKPDWSPHLFLYTNYTNHLSVVRRSFVDSVGGLRPEFDGSQDYDLLLRVHASQKEPLNVVHVPKVLYHWREAAGSTALDYSKKSYAFEAGRKALTEYMKSKGVTATVEAIKETPGFFREYITPTWCDEVVVVVNTSQDSAENESIIQKLRTITKTDLKVVYTQASAPKKTPRVAVVEINTRALPVDPAWLDQLVGVLELQTAAAVSPKIVSSDAERVIDLGIVHGPNGEKIPLQKNHGTRDLTIAGGAAWVRDVDELTGNILCYRSEQGPSKLKNQNFVIWTHIIFCAIPGLGGPTSFNNNLTVYLDGRITLND